MNGEDLRDFAINLPKCADIQYHHGGEWQTLRADRLRAVVLPFDARNGNITELTKG